MDLRGFQAEQKEWSDRNFDNSQWHLPLMGMVEEMGELHHALLKQAQGIRGDFASHEAAAQDAIGDLLVYTADLCTSRGWDLQAILEQTWRQVKARNWVANPENGKVDTVRE